MEEDVKVVEIPKKEGAALMLAATGSPYLLIVRQENKGVRHVLKEGFDFDWLFDVLKEMAKEDAELRSALMDYIIDLLKELKS